MSMLPSPIPHPLDYCPWDVPGWIHEALDWVVGVEWPEGNERAVWDLADQWYGVAEVLAGPRTDAIGAASEVRSGYGGVGLVAEAFDSAWRKLAEGEDAPLPVLLAVSGELGKLVESCGCDIEGAKLEAWIELGILVIELLSLAVATVLTLGAASPAAGAAITASRVVVQQIFKRLVAQLARKALKDGLKEAGERAAKEVVRSGARGLARRAALGGLVEAGQEAGTSLATQTYQNSTGRRDGLDLSDVGLSTLGGFAGGAVAPLAGLGRHADGGLAQVGERFVREMAGETLAEGAAGLATGQGVSLEDLARAAASGAGGSATGQAETAMHHRLDGKLAALSSPPTDLAVPLPAADDVAPIPAQHAVEPVVASAGSTDAIAQPGAPHPAPTFPVSGGSTPTPPAERLSAPVHLPEPLAGAAALAADPVAGSSLAGAAASPMLSSVAVEPPVAAAHPLANDPRPGRAAPPADLPASNQVAPAHVHPAPAVVSGPPPGPPQPHGPTPSPGDRSAGGMLPPQAGALTATPPHQRARPPVDPGAGPAVTGPDNRPPHNPRFPLLEALAPAPRRPTHDSSPALPGPFDPLPPRRRTPEELAAWRAAEREALDRRRHQAYLRSQREWYEDNRRRSRILHLRRAAEQQVDAARWLLTRADELAESGQLHLAAQHRREARLREDLSYRFVDEADAIQDGLLVPAKVMVEDDADFYRINDDVADLAPGAVETSDTSALTGDGRPPPVDRSRRYGVRGGLRPPLALHQTDLERQMPRNPDGSVVRTADPRYGGWFQLANDGGPLADATRSINCLDCTLSLYETWVHGRPRVSAPRTFDGYLDGDVRRPVGGEADGPMRVEEVTGGQFQNLCPGPDPRSDLEARQRVEGGYRDLHGQLLAGGHGSYAFLITSYAGGGSHAWVALNQNGTVLYLDPQQGIVADRPLYPHSGISNPANVVGIDALVLGPDGRPMPLPGRPLGTFNVLPELRERPEPPRPADPPPPYDGDDDPPDFNRVHLLGESTTFHRAADPPAPGGAPDAGPGDVRRVHLAAHTERISAGLYVRDAIAANAGLDQVFAAGVTAVELAQHLDVPTLQRLVPELDEPVARDVARLLADPRVQRMLDQVWEAPPRGEPLLAETLVRQLTQHPELVRIILATPELADSLTARPLTLHHLASHQQAIDVLGDVLDEIAQRGAEAVVADASRSPVPTPLSDEQRTITEGIPRAGRVLHQPNFDVDRKDDESYRRQYLSWLYAEAASAQPELAALAVRMAGEVGTPGWRVAPKDHGRVLDKLVEYGNDVSLVKDLAGAKIEFERLEDLYRTLQRISAEPGVEILDKKDRFARPQRSGYRDVLLNLRMSNGHIAELRLQLSALELVAKWDHSLYEVRRDLHALAELENRPLTLRERAIRDGLLRREQQAFWDALRDQLEREQT